MNGSINSRKIAAVLLALLPLLDIYSFPFFINNLATVVQIVILFLFIFVPPIEYYYFDSKNEILNKHYQILLLCVYAIVVSMIANINYGFNDRKLISIVLILLILYHIMSSKIDFSFFISIYLNIAVLCCVYIIMQFFFAICFNFYLPSNILPFEISKDVFDARILFEKIGLYRPSSFFSEPASFSQYVIPALCLYLSKKQTKKNQIAIYVMLVGIIISTSSLGILSAFLAWIITLYRRTEKNLIKILGGIILLITIGFITINVNSYVSDSMSKIFGGGVSGKTDDRVYRGFAIFSQIPLEYKLFGIGLGNAEKIIKENAITTIYDSRWYTTYDYYNNISSALIYGGVVGGIAFIWAFGVFLRKNDSASKTIAIVFLVMSCASSMFFNTMFLFYGVCLIATTKYAINIERESYA